MWTWFFISVALLCFREGKGDARDPHTLFEGHSEEGKRCHYWKPMVGKTVTATAEPVLDSQTVASKEACVDMCNNDHDCRSVSIEPAGSQFDCKTYAFDEDILNGQALLVDNAGSEVQICELEYGCVCCIRGDPILTMMDGRRKKVVDDGVYNFAMADLTGADAECSVSVTVLTHAPYATRPNLHKVKSLTIEYGKSNPLKVEVISTPLLDEIAELRVNGEKITPPMMIEDTGGRYSFTESSGSLKVAIFGNNVDKCPVKLHFDDFKSSETCVSFPFHMYHNNLAGLCGKCPGPSKTSAFNNNLNPVDFLLGG